MLIAIPCFDETGNMKKKNNNGLQLVQNLHGQICDSLLFQFVDIEFDFRFNSVRLSVSMFILPQLGDSEGI